MRAVDTNILVRWITNDDESQAALAEAIMAEPVYLSLTVIVELAWVLGTARYRLARPVLAEVLANLLDTDTVAVEREDDVRWCVARFAQGADFADMIHLISTGGAAVFVTFDRDLAPAAGSTSPITIETLA